MKILSFLRLAATSGLFVLASTVAHAATLTLAWDPSSDSSVAGYVVQYGTQTGVYSQEVNAGNQLQATLGTLNSGVSYYFVVLAYDGAGNRSAPSNEVSATPTSPITALSLSSNLPSPQVTGTTIQWSAMASGGVSPYQYQWFVANNGTTIQTGGWSTMSTLTWQPTTASANYAISVSARSANSTTGAAELTQTVPFVMTVPVSSSSNSAPTVSSITLVNSTSDKALTGYDPLANGATFSLSKTGTRLNIRANASGSPTSVKFTLDGQAMSADSTSPFFMLTDKNGNSAAWTPTVGTHTVTATPYGTGGTAGSAYSVSFTVTK